MTGARAVRVASDARRGPEPRAVRVRVRVRDREGSTRTGPSTRIGAIFGLDGWLGRAGAPFRAGPRLFAGGPSESCENHRGRARAGAGGNAGTSESHLVRIGPRPDGPGWARDHTPGRARMGT
jgi:hypothetical protein